MNITLEQFIGFFDSEAKALEVIGKYNGQNLSYEEIREEYLKGFPDTGIEEEWD